MMPSASWSISSKCVNPYVYHPMKEVNCKHCRFHDNSTTNLTKNYPDEKEKDQTEDNSLASNLDAFDFGEDLSLA